MPAEHILFHSADSCSQDYINYIEECEWIFLCVLNFRIHKVINRAFLKNGKHW